MKKYSIVILFTFVLHCVLGQSISGVVNTYVPIVSINPCDYNKLEVANSSGFSIGDRVLIIQMQGLTINETNSSAFGSFNAATDTTTGYYEIAVISSISGNEIAFTNNILNKYNPNKNVQLVHIPQYTNVTVNGTLTPKAWDGSTGGVLAIEVSGTLTIAANISAQGRGFRGGKRLAAIANSCSWLTNITDYATDTITWHYKSFKGEGVASYVPNKWGSRGPQANGGGGGNDHNAGGGGGANRAPGGLGGRNNEPGTFNCKGYQPGLGGLALSTLSGDRIFMGGGGGTGHENNNVMQAGGNGGGIIYIKANNIVVSGNRTINASGDSSIMSGQDGGSGGGAGGTIIFDVNSISGNLVLAANGGRGASTNNANTNRCFGPGGGGSGGYIKVTASSLPGSVTLQTNAGAPGIVHNTSNATCRNTSNSGTAGGAGSAELASTAVPTSSKAISNCNPLPVSWLSFEATLQQKTCVLQWITASEINNDYFEVLRSADGINYTKIGMISGNGTTTQISKYNYIDYNPLNGSNYYKLKQVDNDKKTDYSTIQFVYNGLNWTSNDILLFPNPIEHTKNEVRVVFPSTQHSIRAEIIDMTGQLIYIEDISKEDAYNGHLNLKLPQKGYNQMVIIRLVASSGETFFKKLLIQ